MLWPRAQSCRQHATRVLLLNRGDRSKSKIAINDPAPRRASRRQGTHLVGRGGLQPAQEHLPRAARGLLLLLLLLLLELERLGALAGAAQQCGGGRGLAHGFLAHGRALALDQPLEVLNVFHVACNGLLQDGKLLARGNGGRQRCLPLVGIEGREDRRLLLLVLLLLRVVVVTVVLLLLLLLLLLLVAHCVQGRLLRFSRF